MKILVFSWRDPKHPLAGGAEQVMHEHMKGWIQAGHKVTLFSSKMKNLPKEEILDGVKIIRSGYQYWGVQFAGYFYYLKNHKNYDFVVDQFHGLPFFTPLYIGKPKLAVIQETAREVWFLNPLPWPLNWIIGSIGYLGEPFIFLLYRRTLFMTGSQSAKDDVVYFCIPEKNIAVVPHGVIVQVPKFLPTKENIFTVVYLGILSKDKGVEDAIKAFNTLNNLGKFRFWVIGKSEVQGYESYLKQMIRKLALQESVKFWGYVSQQQKFELLAQAHVLINPSLREGWGLVNIEANAFGTPVVAYNSPGLVDSVKDGFSGIICKNNTPSDLARNIFQISVDQDLYSSLQEGARKWSKNFSWKKSRKLSLDLIERLVYEH